MKVLALDPATKTGWAYSSDGVVHTASGVWDFSVKRDESGGMRLIRLESKLEVIRNELGVDLLVFEAARNAGPHMQGAVVVQSELQGVMKYWSERCDVQYRGYSPTEIKKWATGKGNSGKPLMVEAARLKWPGVEIVDDNQADAMHLLDLALSEYGQV